MRNKLLNISIVLCFLLVYFTATSHAVEKKYPFKPGEKLRFKLSWEFIATIPAGDAMLEVHPMTTIDGISAYHFSMTAKSNSFVDIFYKVRDRIDSYTDTNIARSLLYKKSQKEGSVERDVVVNFDWENKKAQYSNFGKLEKSIPIKPGSLDPLSVLYYARISDFKPGSVIRTPVSDGKKCVIGKAKIIKREIISVGGQKYDTYLMEPDLKHIGGVFRKSKNAGIKIWITADERRLVVKIQSKVIVGNFTGELVSVE